MFQPAPRIPALALRLSGRRAIAWLFAVAATLSVGDAAYAQADGSYALGASFEAPAALLTASTASISMPRARQTANRGAVAAATGSPAVLIDLEKNPPLPQGPSAYVLAGPAKTITVPNEATLSGGTILGNATNFPAQSYATAPNVYATTSQSAIAGADPSLQSTLSIDIAAGYAANEVSFPLFNGTSYGETYTVTAYAGAAAVATQSLSLASNTASGFGIVDLVAPGITRVTITPAFTHQAGYWNYAIDTIAMNQTVQNALKTPTSLTLSATPNPAAANQTVTASVAVMPTAGSGTPTGSATVTDGTASCTATLTNGRGNCALSFAGAGNRSLIATYAGDANFAPSSGTYAIAVNPIVTPPSVAVSAPALSTWAVLTMIAAIAAAARTRRRPQR